MARSYFFKEWRKHAGYTQEAAGAELGLDRAYISRIESNGEKRRRYNETFLETAARIYGCSDVEDLYHHPDDYFVRVLRKARKVKGRSRRCMMKVEAAIERVLKEDDQKRTRKKPAKNKSDGETRNGLSTG